jgi:hypothetical protein
METEQFKVKSLCLRMSLKTKWFQMTKAGIKTEDYREINGYWVKRLFRDVDKTELQDIIKGLREGRSIEWAGLFHLHFLKDFEVNTMTLGYPKSNDSERILNLKHKGIKISTGNPEWGAEPNKLYFVIMHGAILA